MKNISVLVESEKDPDNSEELFQMLFNSSPDAVFLSLPDKSIKNANPAACKMFGLSVNEFRQLGPRGLIDAEDPRMSAAIAERDSTGKFSGELTAVRSDGSKFPVELTSAYFKVSKSKMMISSIVRDISVRKKTEDALRLSETKYRMLHETMMDGFGFTSMAGKIMEFNEVYREMLGYSKEEILKLTYQDITPEKWHEYENNIVRNQVLVNGYSVVYEKEYIKKDGTVFPVELRTLLLKDDTGENKGMWAIVRDITDRKSAEANLLMLNRQLNELNVSKDKFFSIIAHDLKNPFTAIVGFSSVMAEQLNKNEIEKLGEYAKNILLSSQKAMNLLNNLMEWSKSQSGRMNFNPEPVNVEKLIRETTDLLNFSALQKSISISLEIQHGMHVIADKAMLSSILRNLISNAVKFTFPGGNIFISVVQNETELLVSIKDNGVGIEKTEITKLFRIEEPYTATGTLNEEGTGLGLMLCHEFINNHNGKIWVDSEPGKGTTFFFSIPCNLICKKLKG